MDVLGPLAGLAERFFGDRAKRRAADLRIADGARQLRRELLASFEDWPNRPRTLDELTSWAHKLTRGYRSTDPALRELVGLRPDASAKIRRAVGKARDAYEAAGDLVNPLVRTSLALIASGGAPPSDADARLRRAAAHVRRCIKELEAASATKD